MPDRKHRDDPLAHRFLRVLHARVGAPCRATYSNPSGESATWSISARLRRIGPLFRYCGRKVVDRLDDQLVVLLVEQPDGGGLGLHHLADDLHGALQHLLQVAGVGQHHRDVVDGRQLVDPLAELELLEAEPGDGVGQQEQELDGGGAGVAATWCSCAASASTCLRSSPNFAARAASFASSMPGWPMPLADMRIVPSRWSLTMIGATNSAPSCCGLRLAASAFVERRRLGQRALAAEELPGRRRLREHVPCRVGDRRLHLRDGREAVLDLLQRRQVHEIGQVQVVGVEHSHSDPTLWARSEKKSRRREIIRRPEEGGRCVTFVTENEVYHGDHGAHGGEKIGEGGRAWKGKGSQSFVSYGFGKCRAPVVRAVVTGGDHAGGSITRGPFSAGESVLR